MTRKFLAISGFFPFPATNGFTLRVSALLRTLSSCGVNIDLVCFGEPSAVKHSGKDTREFCRRVESVPHELASLSQFAGHFRRCSHLLSPIPYAVARFYSEAFRERVSSLLNSTHYDAILCETPYMLVNLPEKLRPPLLMDAHNVENSLLIRYLPLESNPLKRLYVRIEGGKMAKWERYAFSRSDLVIACSELDRDAIRRLCPHLTVSVIPNTIDTETYNPCTQGGSHTILYLGGMDWFPNRDAVQYFVSKILPLVRASVPDSKFLVAGRSPAPNFRRQFDSVSGVEFTGTLPDLRPAIAEAAVIVVPLRVGSGTRFKILEAAAMEKSIVSTTLGAEGLDFTDGEELILADNPAAFAEAVVNLLKNPERRNQLGRSARKRATQQYGFSALAASVKRMLDQVDAFRHVKARDGQTSAIMLADRI
jgi:glycosyltransferase involved in cell wall biosynthesis